jgi:hypothetical protein
MTTNQIAYFGAKEQQRHNYAVEMENQRHNVRTEDISQETNTINRSHLERMDSETQRHNLATEQQAREQLNLGYAQLDLGNRTLAETSRHNKASENLTLQSLSETVRHNFVSETLARDTYDEQVRVNNVDIQKGLAQTNLSESQAAYNDANAAYIKTQNTLLETELPYAKINAGVKSQQEAWKLGQMENETKTYALRTGLQTFSSLFNTVVGGGLKYLQLQNTTSTVPQGYGYYVHY